MARSKSSSRWLQQHFNDQFVKQAQLEGYRSRAAYKLIEINQKYQLIANNQNIVDLGAAPGSWLQVLQKFSNNSKIIGVDLLAIEPINNVELITGDFTDSTILEQLLVTLQDKPVNLILSDMAPNMSGHAEIDIPKAMYLAELAEDFAAMTLVKGGNLLMKIFQGEGFDALLKSLRQNYRQVIICKPKASSPKSKEIYLFCKYKQ